MNSKLEYKIKKALSMLPSVLLLELRRLLYRRRLAKGKFISPESEFEELSKWISAGDCVLDIGANIGHYTVEMAGLVGKNGRVFAFEPIPQSFDILSTMVASLENSNVTLLNIAASSEAGMRKMTIPMLDSGLPNFYMAKLDANEGAQDVVCLKVESIPFSQPIRFAKIDVEGHELDVLKGMTHILRRDRPRLLVEGQSDDVAKFLESLGYIFVQTPGSPNRLYEQPGGE